MFKQLKGLFFVKKNNINKIKSIEYLFKLHIFYQVL